MDINQVIAPPDAVVGIAMHCGASGHNKDWIGFVTKNGFIHTAWGAAGSHYKTAVRQSNQAGFQRLVQEKATKGYIVVDNWSPQAGWSSYAQAIQQATAKAALQQMTNKGAPPVKPTSMGKLVDITKGIKAPKESLGWDF